MKDETKFLESMLDLTIELAQKVKNQNKLIETLTHQIKDLSGITEDNGKIVKATCSQLTKDYETALNASGELLACPACDENNICGDTGNPCDYCENDGGYEPR